MIYIMQIFFYMNCRKKLVMSEENAILEEERPNWRALIPFIVFVVFYVGLSIWAKDFYKIPMPVAFIVASATAMLSNRKMTLQRKMDVYAAGMGNVDIMTMCLIFILAGVFAKVAKEMGAVEATVNLALNFIPVRLLICGMFLVACFISLSVGTSVGTVVALAPIAGGISQSCNISIGVILGAVVGGAMFGDNLSMISDTTIAATRTQNVALNQEFYANLKIVVPAALFTMALYLLFASSENVTPEVKAITGKDVVRIMPYLAVLILALCGMNVMALLLFGAIFAGCIGLSIKSFDFFGFLKGAGDGALSMSETLIVALLSGGLLKVIRQNGGIGYLMQVIERHIQGRRGGEFGIALLVAAVNVFTANNTVAIVIAGPIAKEISDRYGIAPARSASILDATSCVIQGIIPYGAQILVAVSLAGVTVSALQLLSYLWYPYMLGLFLILAIASGYPKIKTDKAA